jgi:uncharacterized membrane protein YbhN (UPF0104 family)
LALTGDQGQSPVRGRILRILSLLVAGSLLWLAATRVPWRDELSVAPGAAGGEGVQVVFEGDLQGDWQADWALFRFAAGTLPDDSPLRGTLLETALVAGGRVWTHRQGLAEVNVDDPGSPPEQVTWRASVTWRPGMPSAFRRLEAAPIARALGFVLLCVLAIVTRWWRLLALTGCATAWMTCLRLTFVGLFFNTVLPGSTGGDLARAYVVIRDHPDRRAGALVSVIMDRVLGLVAMTLLASAAVATADERFAFLLPWTLGASMALIGGLLVFSHPGLRRLLRVEHLLGKLPQGRRLLDLDSNIRAVLRSPGALLMPLVLSLANHLCATAAVYSLGRAFGADLSFHDFLCVCTVANTLSAVPISPGGLGVGEVLFGSLFELAGSLYMLGVASSFTYRLVMMAAGLLGGLALVLPGGGSLLAELRAGRRAAAAHED